MQFNFLALWLQVWQAPLNQNLYNIIRLYVPNNRFFLILHPHYTCSEWSFQIINSTSSSLASAIKNSSGPLTTGATPNPPSTPLAMAVTGVSNMPAVTPHAPATHPLQPSLVPQRLVLSSQAQARLPSKWPPHHRQQIGPLLFPLSLVHLHLNVSLLSCPQAQQ